MITPLTDEQKKAYVKSGGLHCPYCGAESEHVGSCDRDQEGDTITQTTSCDGCDRSWTDIFRLVDIQEHDNTPIAPAVKAEAPRTQQLFPVALAALKASIEHWERMRDGKEVGSEEPNGYHCALCLEFIFKHSRSLCEGCPVYAETGEVRCFGTPFQAALNAWKARKENRDQFSEAAWRAAADDQITFLKCLLPK